MGAVTHREKSFCTWIEVSVTQINFSRTTLGMCMKVVVVKYNNMMKQGNVQKDWELRAGTVQLRCLDP